MSAHDNLRQALEKIASGMGRDLLGTTSLSREDMQAIAQAALSAPAPGREEMREGIRSTILDWMQSYDGPLSNEQMAYAVAERILALTSRQKRSRRRQQMHFDVCNRKCGPVVPLTEKTP